MSLRIVNSSASVGLEAIETRQELLVEKLCFLQILKNALEKNRFPNDPVLIDSFINHVEVLGTSVSQKADELQGCRPNLDDIKKWNQYFLKIRDREGVINESKKLIKSVVQELENQMFKGYVHFPQIQAELGVGKQLFSEVKRIQDDNVQKKNVHDGFMHLILHPLIKIVKLNELCLNALNYYNVAITKDYFEIVSDFQSFSTELLSFNDGILNEENKEEIEKLNQRLNKMQIDCLLQAIRNCCQKDPALDLSTQLTDLLNQLPKFKDEKSQSTLRDLLYKEIYLAQKQAWEDKRSDINPDDDRFGCNFGELAFRDLHLNVSSELKLKSIHNVRKSLELV